MGGGSVGAAPSYLDGLAVTPTLALSLKKVISTATNAIRVRRSNDNAEQDIGFSGNALDTTALAAFVGSNSAYVTKFYDQTGNGRDAVQATAANQPRIVNAGAYDGMLVWDGTNDSMKIASVPQGTPYFAIYSQIMRADVISGSRVLIEGSSNYNSNGQNFILFNGFDGGGSDAWSMNACNAAGSQRQHFYGAAAQTLGQRTFLWDRSIVGTGEIALRSGGVLATPVVNFSVEQTGNFTSYDVYIGARGGTSLFADMGAASLVFYNADTSSIVSAIEAIV